VSNKVSILASLVGLTASSLAPLQREDNAAARLVLLGLDRRAHVTLACVEATALVAGKLQSLVQNRHRCIDVYSAAVLWTSSH